VNCFLVIEEASSEVEWRVGFSLVTEGVGLIFQGGGSWLDVLLGLEV
jgi:hypothetical protein